MKVFLSVFCYIFTLTSLIAQKKVDTIYTESYSGFLDGEIGDCIGNSEYCDEDNTVIFPIGAPLKRIQDMRYKRIFSDSSHQRIAREYIKGEDSVFLFAGYHPISGRMAEYGALYLKYDSIVYTPLEDYNNDFDLETKAILAIQPIRIVKMGFWQESLNVGLKAGYYYDDEPVASWNYYALPFFYDLNLVSEVWTYTKGEITQRDTLNLIEKKITEQQAIQTITNTKWYLKGQNKAIVYLDHMPKDFPYETWQLKNDGVLEITMHSSANYAKTYTGNWTLETPLKVKFFVPDFLNITLNLRYLTEQKMLFLK